MIVYLYVFVYGSQKYKNKMKYYLFLFSYITLLLPTNCNIYLVCLYLFEYMFFKIFTPVQLYLGARWSSGSAFAFNVGCSKIVSPGRPEH